LYPAKVIGNLLRAADLAEDCALEPALDPVEVTGDLLAEVVVAIRYHPLALYSSNWNSCFVSFANNVEEQLLKNGGKPIKICYLISLDKDQNESI
jgi:hypothetical protein